jgi:hypothetical protein
MLTTTEFFWVSHVVHSITRELNEYFMKMVLVYSEKRFLVFVWKFQFFVEDSFVNLFGTIYNI